MSGQPEAANPGGGLVALLVAMRPAHWVKNIFVVAPILFAGEFLHLDAWWRCLVAVGAFCLLSSSVYLHNDVLDRTSDRAHPQKCSRPVASGRVSVALALSAALVLALVGMVLAWVPCEFPRRENLPFDGYGLVIWALGYLLLNLLYSLWLKHHLIIDVILVSLGFVLRAMAGAAAIAVPISPWLVVCTFTLCLFIALSKRRGELRELPAEVASNTRSTNRAYTIEGLNRMLVISAALAIMTYSLYCLAPRTVHHLGSGHMVWTIPLVVYGIFRYDLISQRIHKGDVVNVLLSDRILWVVLILYGALCLAVIRYGADPAIREILDVGFGPK